jgi:hypothetical protein
MRILHYTIGCLILFLAACEREVITEFTPGSDSTGSITRFTVYDGFMYALNQKEVLTYRLDNPDKPELVHRLPLDYGLETIIVYDDVMYIGSRFSLYIVDISAREQPRLSSESSRLELGLFGGCDPVAVRANYAYSTVKIIQNICGNLSQQSALITYDVRDKQNPIFQSQINMSIPNGLGFKGDRLFICDEGTDRLEIFDLTTPSDPLLTGGIPIIDPVDLIVREDKMIVSTKTNFHIYDVSDLSQIRLIATLNP